jgi:hypothetical protein
LNQTVLGNNVIGCIRKTDEHLHDLRFEASVVAILTDPIEFWFDQELANPEGNAHDHSLLRNYGNWKLVSNIL